MSRKLNLITILAAGVLLAALFSGVAVAAEYEDLDAMLEVNNGKIKALEAGVKSIEAQAAAERAKSIQAFDPGGFNAAIENLKMSIETIKNQNKQITEAKNNTRYLKFIDAAKKAGSNAVSSALRSALNTLAFDTATMIGSGAKGQKPLFYTEFWGEYISNSLDSAAGTFLESLGKNDYVKFNLCQPDLALSIKIGLGLKAQTRPRAPACTFSKMKENWEKELNDPNFLGNFKDMFNPTSNDVGIALSLQTGLSEETNRKLNEAILQRQEGNGWKIGDNATAGQIYNKITSVPGDATRRLNEQSQLNALQITKSFPDILVEAGNIFLNQLAITAFNKAMAKLGEKSVSINNLSDALANRDAGPVGGGITEAKSQLRQIVEPKFDVKGDYDILSELSMCLNPAKAGPTNCVIDDKLRQAIQEKVTVGEALEKGYLNKEGVFGFVSRELEPGYKEGYSYRSMIILRKFRILPVGWEVAAQYIKDNLDKIGGTKNIKFLVDCFDSTNPNDSWCKGLVDPNWVLKAPLNYCKRQGSGPEILSSDIVGSGSASELTVQRNDNYCADEQSCIKENSDGSCQLYGYCTEERRKWKFDSKSCEPKYNTCQTFKTADGQTASYLENTLDFSGCSIDNAGCQAYSTDYDYTTGKFLTGGDQIFLDRDATACEASNEGCHEFVRAKIGLGANILKNSSFEADLAVDGWGALGSESTTAFDGAKGLELSTAGTPTYAVSVGPSDYTVSGDVFTLSFYSNGCATSSSFEIVGQDGQTGFSGNSGWQRNATTYIVPKSISANQVSFKFNDIAAGCVIDAIKLEHGYQATAYNDYAANQPVYEKLIPEYLRNECYDNLGNLKDTAPAECANFARTCQLKEVGCEMFTSVDDKMQVPAKVASYNYCVQECVGFKQYLQTESSFDSSRPENFIPATAKTCSAAAAGCDQFTNLDKVAAGGEGIEYYSDLRQCVLANAPTCAQFYTWEGSNESGFQLKVVTLDSPAGMMRITDPAKDNSLCSEAIYNLSPSDPAYNSDCREFYDINGQKSYHSYSLTVSCSDDCHPYRRTENNIDPTKIDSGACVLAGGNWGDVNGDGVDECGLCKNGGIWNIQHNACLYNAIPNEGRTCQPVDNGCREYTGSTGQNFRVVVNHDFEDGTKQGWKSVSGISTLMLSTESIVMGGHSLQGITVGTAQFGLDVNSIVQQDKSYSLSFIAKRGTAGPANSLTLKLVSTSTPASEAIFGNVILGADWQLYTLNLSKLNHVVSGEQLAIIADGRFFIDNIKLSEITNRYYLVKNSWQTPAVCNADLNGKASPAYMLGCSEYTDRDKQTHYLRSFDYLCSESAVGCELMIDTQNSGNSEAETFNAGDDSEQLVPADNYEYVVYDKAKQCKSEDKGCQRLGSPESYEGTTMYSDTYLRNNPDKYKTSLCMSDAVQCQEYLTEAGNSYFKTPGNQICEWRQQENTSNFGWYKRKVNRCDVNGDGKGDGAVCFKDGDCTSGQKCLLEGADRPCATDSLKTIGQGGAGNIVAQPQGPATGTTTWVGACPAEFSGCTELIDPLTQFSNNLIFNGDFEALGGGGFNAGWGSVAPFKQVVNLESFTLYRLAGYDSSGNTLTLTCSSAFHSLDPETNQLTSTGGSSFALPLDSFEKSRQIYTGSNVSCSVTVASANANAHVELKKIAVDYQLAKELDTKSCNGVVNFDDGCILFNERSQQGTSIAKLNYDADAKSSNPTTVIAATVSSGDSNTLIKVAPDRVCDKWLACRSKVAVKNENGDDVNFCFDVGLCNGMDDKGNCSNFISKPVINQTYSGVGGGSVSAGSISNLVGYSKVGYANTSSKEPNDYYNLANMKQSGEVLSMPNGSFEYYDSNGYPNGWNWVKLDNSSPKSTWDKSVFKVVGNPIEAQSEGVKYPVDGRGLLKLGAGYNATSDFIEVGPGKYVISAQINTKNSSLGAARVRVVGYNAGGATSSVTISPELSLNSGNEWTFKLGLFEILGNIKKIEIVLDATIGSTGNIYFDDIKVAPALNSRKEAPGSLNDWYTSNSCRLYPQTDSLSCSYYDDSGRIEKGWKGYCLEHDRQPGNPDACLLWWPVDKIKGDGVEEAGGYSGKSPVYYCSEAKALVPLKYKRYTKWIGHGGCDWDGSPYCADLVNLGYTCIDGGGTGLSANGGGGCDNGDQYFASDALPTGECLYDCKKNSTGVVLSGWYSLIDSSGAAYFTKYNSYHCAADGWSCAGIIPTEPIEGVIDERKYGLKYLDPSSGEVYNDIFAYCNKVVQTVSLVGDNKYWSNKVFEGSSYQVAGLGAAGTGVGYSADAAPFGSLIPPAGVKNPFEWDGSNKEGIQPLMIKTSGARAGFPYSIIGLNQFNERSRLPATGAIITTPITSAVGVCQISKRPCLTVDGINFTPATSTCPIENACSNKADCGIGDVCQPANFSDDPISKIQSLFAQSYGAWEFRNDPTLSYHYMRVGNVYWTPPEVKCLDNTRPTIDSWCGVSPTVPSILVNGSSTGLSVSRSSIINLTFNSKVDSQQLPLVYYEVSWGDGESTTVSGVEMYDRPNTDRPHSLYHSYSFWDLKNRSNSGVPGITCSDTQCSVTPRIKVKDNWGWCNGDLTRGQCDKYVPYGGEVVVREN